MIRHHENPQQINSIAIYARGSSVWVNTKSPRLIDGPTVASDLDKTEANKALMQSYMDDLLHGRRQKFAGYFDGNHYIPA